MKKNYYYLLRLFKLIQSSIRLSNQFFEGNSLRGRMQNIRTKKLEWSSCFRWYNKNGSQFVLKSFSTQNDKHAQFVIQQFVISVVEICRLLRKISFI